MERLMRSTGLLDADRYPEVTYRAMRMGFVGDEPRRIDGVLTLRGVSKAVALKVTGYDCASFNGLVPQHCRVSAVGMFRRSDFGMTGYQAVAGNKVRLAIEVEAVPVSGE
jgi:polyisoprenoid-binding protein YceI